MNVIESTIIIFIQKIINPHDLHNLEWRFKKNIILDLI